MTSLSAVFRSVEAWRVCINCERSVVRVPFLPEKRNSTWVKTAYPEAAHSKAGTGSCERHCVSVDYVRTKYCKERVVIRFGRSGTDCPSRMNADVG